MQKFSYTYAEANRQPSKRVISGGYFGLNKVKLKLQDNHQIYWHPAFIKWYLHISYKSSSAYHAICSTNMLTLPSERITS